MIEIDLLDKSIRELKTQRYKFMKKEMDSFKGKYFEEIPEDPVKINVFKILTSNWDNSLDYICCYYCKDKHSVWGKVDEEGGFSYESYDLEKLQNLVEISKEEYLRKRAIVIQHLQYMELEQIKKKYAEMEEKEK